jgi:hypothetical protein
MRSPYPDYKRNVFTTPAAQPAPVQEPSIAACIIGADAVGKKIDGYEAAKVYAAMQKAMGAPTAAQPAVPAVPEGWKLVPIEPTQEMIDAFPQIRGEDVGRELWADLLAAAPQGSDNK